MKRTTFLLISLPLSIIAFTMLWFGYEGVLVNLNGNLKAYTIEEVEQKGVGSSRYVEVSGGIALGNYVPMTDDYGRIQKVLYPIGSTENIAQIFEGKKIKVSILVLDSDIDPDCVKTKSCVNTGEILARGITERGIDLETRNKIRELNDELVELDDHLIVVKSGTKPRALYLNVILIITSVVFLFFLVVSVAAALKR